MESNLESWHRLISFVSHFDNGLYLDHLHSFLHFSARVDRQMGVIIVKKHAIPDPFILTHILQFGVKHCG
jgi:hypothetical protein